MKLRKINIFEKTTMSQDKISENNSKVESKYRFDESAITYSLPTSI
jgi:hypothetical protein